MKTLGLIIVTVSVLLFAVIFILFVSGKLENDMVPFGAAELLMTIIYFLPPLAIGMLLLKYNELKK